jgi:peptidoglycan/LPS O-acetylase OafA/YrhL
MMTPRCPRYQSLDIWRGVACLSVIIFHATLYAKPAHDATWSGDPVHVALQLCSIMWIGVPIFFVISGYCIAGAADSNRQRNRPISDYFIRRFRRIYPPLWACLLLSIPIIAALEYVRPGLLDDENHPIAHPGALSLSDIIGNFTLTETWLHHVDGESNRFFLNHTWTLCYEEQFYLVVGLALLLSRRWLFSTLGGVTAVAIALMATRQHGALRGTFLDGAWTDFAAGLAVYWTVNYGKRWHVVALGFALLCGLAAMYRGDSLLVRHTFNDQRIAAWAFGIVLLGLHSFDERMARSRILRPLSWCGVMCYSIYLVHLLLTKAVSHSLYLAGLTSAESTLAITVPACLAVCVLAGWAFHVAVERRFLNPPQVATVIVETQIDSAANPPLLVDAT